MRRTSGSPPAPARLGQARGARDAPSSALGSLRSYAWAALVVAAATGAAAGARGALHVPDVEMLFLLGVAIVAVTSSRGPAVFAAATSVLAYDFFFVPPPFTFDVDDARYVLTFAMMLGIGVVISTLALRLREERQAAVDREQRTSALYAVSRNLGAALAASDVGAACVTAANAVLGAPSVLLAPGPGGELAPLAAAPPDAALSPDEREVARWAYLHGSPAGRGTGSLPEATVLCVPLRPIADVLAVLAVRLPGGDELRAGQRDFAEAVSRQSALALERIRLAEVARSSALRAEAEELRSGLLSAVSHDLRTPLAAITGAATTLRDDAGLDEETRRGLLDAVCEEAERLERLVRNLLDMTRLESGAVQPRREWIPVVELVGSALARVEGQLAGREVATAFAEDLPLVAVDPVLIEQLLVNVLENATKYTPARSPIEISASRDAGAVTIEVADRGPGIPAGAEERIFERFHRGAHEGAAGAGLGLAIARAIAHAHGGTLAASSRSGGGALFRLSLPVSEPPPLERAELAP